jgi:phospholipid/cholesterol/gamma-HCH transport system substrate-binding protein
MPHIHEDVARGRCRRRRALRAAALLACLLLVAPVTAACGFGGLASVPLPGGPDVGAHPRIVKAEFSDVLNLVPQSAVKVDEVPVGTVTKIELEPDNTTALVTMRVNGDTHLAANATAAVRQASLLGAKYVEVSDPPEKQARGTLPDGGTIPLARTETTATVEEVLGALSLLLNGGGVQRIGTITRELNKALVGNEPQIRSLFSHVDSAVGDLDRQRKNIVHAIDGLHRLSGVLARQKGTIAHALDDLTPGITLLNHQRHQLVTMLHSLDKLSTVAVDTVNKSRDDLVANLKSLRPVLHKLAEAGDSLPKSLQLLLTYPFGKYAMNDLRGDFFNAEIHLNLDLGKLLQTLDRSPQPIIPQPGSGGNVGPKPGGSQGGTPGPQFPALPLPTLDGGAGGGSGGGITGVLRSLLGGH